LTCYQDEASRKRALKKFRTKINVPNTSNSAAAAFHPNRERLNDSHLMHNTTGPKHNVKGNGKIFLQINDVLNQARKDQISKTHTLSDIIKNFTSSQKNKPSRLENINNMNKELLDLNRSRGADVLTNMNDQSLSQDEISDLKKNLNLLNIQKSVLGSAGADKRESRLNHSDISIREINNSSSK